MRRIYSCIRSPSNLSSPLLGPPTVAEASQRILKTNAYIRILGGKAATEELFSAFVHTRYAAAKLMQTPWAGVSFQTLVSGSL